MKRLMTLALAVLLGAGTCRAAEKLRIGDPAPALEVKEFVKGKPVKSLEKGKTYVVEFWATWCGPCRTSIPHLTELQKKYKDVVFIGVSIWERKPEGVKPFVKEMGDKMDYRVAMDRVPDKGDANDGKMATAWMSAAGQNGIPTAFIVNGEGKVAWIGHPMAMGKPLEKITAGKWDVAAAAREHEEEVAARRKMRELQQKLMKAEEDGDQKEVLAIVEQAIADHPKLEGTLGLMKLRALVAGGGDADKAAVYGKRLVETVVADDARGLNFIAKRPLLDFRWHSAFLQGCRFHGTFIGNDFGRRLDSSQSAGIEQCDFSNAVLDMCAFYGCDLATIVLPKWPCFTLVNLAVHLEQMTSLAWPGQLRTWVRTFSSFPLGNMVGATDYAPTLMKRYKVSEEELAHAISRLANLQR